ncbi:MAG: DUF4914 family protein [Firmicutes bacterium]|jgi:hypothetical protein|nr:DUF4914 family protein [Bacillota bacterium]
MENPMLTKFKLPEDVFETINHENVLVPESREQLVKLAIGGQQSGFYEVAYQVPDQGRVLEATVTKCKNGVLVNFVEPYMRRRDPDCMVIGDDKPTDKITYEQRFGEKFDCVRKQTLDWLREQSLIVMPFMAGGKEYGYPALMIAPRNAAFFAAALADMQEFIPRDDIPDGFEPRGIIFVAPPFRHTHFNGKQVVVHNRTPELHEVFSYNLYPGPSAKKGVYAMLLDLGEADGWVTLHASTVKIITPYENVLTIMHEGASGGGKSEMLEQIHRQEDGTVKIGENVLTGEELIISLRESSELLPITDDMAICPKVLQEETGKLVVKDAETGWFLRFDHISEYGTEPYYEKLTIHPKEPLIFLNLDGKPGATCLIWEHIEDEPGQPCPNPRVVLPRRHISGVIDDPVAVDIRSFGVRTPLTTKDNPSYGIIGMFHVLPPSLAWLWRLVSPRGANNPSINDDGWGMESEGVGSYWPFTTGRMVDQANLLLEQFIRADKTRYILIPNQYIGAYEVGFMPQWVTREYLARRGSASFGKDRLVEARCPLLGFAMQSVKVDGNQLKKGLLQVQYQPEVGLGAYDQGAEILTDFFKREVKKYLVDDLHPLGRRIIECCLDDGKVSDYLEFLPMSY